MNDHERAEREHLISVREALAVVTWWMMDKHLNREAPLTTAQITSSFVVLERKGNIGQGVYYKTGTEEASYHCTPFGWIRDIEASIRRKFCRSFAKYNIIGHRYQLNEAPRVDALYAALMTLRPYLARNGEGAWQWPEDEFVVAFEIQAYGRGTQVIERVKSAEEAKAKFRSDHKENVPWIRGKDLHYLLDTIEIPLVNHVSYVPPFVLPPLA
jgi:hypothetical protein